MADRFVIEERVFPEMTILSVRTKDSLKAMGSYTKGLYEQADLRGLRPAGPVFAIYFEKPVDPKNVEYELCLPVEGPPDELDKLADFGGERCLYLRLRGSYARFAAAYQALFDRVAQGGYTLLGPAREVYVRGPLLGFLTFIPTMITDIYVPIAAK